MLLCKGILPPLSHFANMDEILYDVAVIGGGPAGMMAAGRAAACGARVVLLEKNASLGAKLLITGGGRSNITNAQFDPHLFLAKFGDAAKFLFSPFAQFGVEETLDFFHAHGMPTKVEAERRVFPQSDQAQSVWNALVAYMREGSVAIRPGSQVTGIEVASGLVQGLRMQDETLLVAGRYILATGGKSHPETGSTGDGFDWLSDIGHRVVAPRPALVPLRVAESWIAQLAGVSLAEAKLTAFQNDQKILPARTGKILFTHVGLSGPLVLNMSRQVSEFLPYGPVVIAVDFFPRVNLGELDQELQAILALAKNRQMKNSLEGLVLPALIPTLLGLLGIEGGRPTHSLTREERLSIGRLLKDFRVTATGVLGAQKAIVTSGGVDLAEVDCKYMRSRLYPNLFVVGDMLNIDRPSGGYSLQLCWTTGFVAGSAAAEGDLSKEPN